MEAHEAREFEAAQAKHATNGLDAQVQAHQELLIAIVVLIHKVNPAAFKELERFFAERRARTAEVEGYPDPVALAEKIVAVASKLDTV